MVETLWFYLAGGMRSDWRERFIDEVDKEFLHPKYIGKMAIRWLTPQRLPSPDYVENDLHLVSNADILFGYLEKDNPSGLGLVAEMGFAKALGRQIIFVNEQGDDRYTEFLCVMSDDYFTDFDEAVQRLIAITIGRILP